MPNLPDPAVIASKPPPERVRFIRAALDEAAARRGLPPEPWAA